MRSSSRSSSRNREQFTSVIFKSANLLVLIYKYKLTSAIYKLRSTTAQMLLLFSFKQFLSEGGFVKLIVSQKPVTRFQCCFAMKLEEAPVPRL
jgi:hypothetical protein